MTDKKRSLLIGLVYGLVFVLLVAGVLLFTDVLEGGEGNELIELETQAPDGEPAAAEEVGVEVYDFYEYEESREAYQEALAQQEEDWFPRDAVVEPKGAEGGEYPNAPLPVYTSYPGKDFVTEEGETYKIDRTWIGDLAVGTEVRLEDVGAQGEWCFVTGETIGGWSSSGWVWCYRLFIP